MTEHEWATSTDPAAMFTAIRDRVSERQAEAFVRACTNGAMFVKDSDWRTLAARYAKSGSRPNRANLLREIIGPPWRPYTVKPSVTWTETWASYIQDESPGLLALFRGDDIVVDDWRAILTWKNGTIPAIVQDITEERCERCLGTGGCPGEMHDLTCIICSGKKIVPRANPQWELMPVLADALQDAGCDDVTILEHLRRERDGVRCPWCEGSGLIPELKLKSLYPIGRRCYRCNGKGKLFSPFVVGDWALELLKGGDMSEDRELMAGLDLGKLKDPSAFALLDRRRPSLAPNELEVIGNASAMGMGDQKVTIPPRLPFSGQLTKEERRSRWWSYRLSRLKRWDVGTNYDEVLSWLVKAYSKPPRRTDRGWDPRGGLAGTVLAIDYTGVGVAVVEWLQKEMKLAGAKAAIRPIWIQSGMRVAENAAGGWNVPKKELVSVLQMLMGTHRLQVEAAMENCSTLLKELDNFKEKKTEAGNSSYEAWRETDHDDLVLALAVGAWVGEQASREFWVR